MSLTGINLANALNNHFTSISADLPPLDLCSLPAYLPAPVPVPTITHIEVCTKLLKVKPPISHMVLMVFLIISLKNSHTN